MRPNWQGRKSESDSDNKVSLLVSLVRKPSSQNYSLFRGRFMHSADSKMLSIAAAFFALILPATVLMAQAQSSALNGAFDASGWQMQDASKVKSDGATISGSGFSSQGWYTATVPGTVLTTLVNNHVYPEPLYGENLRPEKIPDSLAHSPVWYRTVVKIPASYRGRHVWLHLDGINYQAGIWVNGKQAGTMRGAFIRGRFDVTSLVRPGKTAAIAVLISPQPNPGQPHEHTVREGVGINGGITALDGPTFLSTMGWDWTPAIPDRDTGLWRKVWFSASGPVVIENPQVTTDVHIPDLVSADITIHTTVRNLTAQTQEGDLQGKIGDIVFHHHVSLAPNAAQDIVFDPSSDTSLHMNHPALWWPNGYGPQNLHHLKLSFTAAQQPSEEVGVTFGIRKISYTVSSTDALAFVVNGVPIFIRGGNWGLDEAMKRIPVERLDAQIRMHKLANLNMIRNWVGQSTSEEFFDLCDKYGILVWDEFFQPNPRNGPDPADLDTYMTNVRDTVLRYRNHPSIALWCARNEGNPPDQIDAAMKGMLGKLDPARLYQANSSDGRSVRSRGPYSWRSPRDYYLSNEGFKSETGSISIPTIESIQNMMPSSDWNTINDDWAEHDLALGNSGGDRYPQQLAERYGPIRNLADFARKGQMANYEAFRAMYEGRNSLLFHPATGVLTWMSNPAHPSFVWQIYQYDLEPNSSFFGVKNASEMLHVQFNEVTGVVQVINNFPKDQLNLNVDVQVLAMNGSLSNKQHFSLTAPALSATYAGGVDFHEPLSQVFFIWLRLTDATGRLVSENFYWENHPENLDKMQGLNKMPNVKLNAQISREDKDGQSRIHVVLHNPTHAIALMAHVQLRRASTNDRVLPIYYSDNYVSLVGGEDKAIDIECATDALQGQAALVVVDGWNVSVSASSSQAVSIKTNENAQVAHWPETGLPMQEGR